MSKLNPLVLYGAVGVSALVVIGYLIYRQKNSQYSGFGLFGFLGNTADAASGGALASAGENIGGALFDFFNEPSDLVTYAITFPDGARHAVNSSDVDKSGHFTYAGQNYLLKVDGLGYKFAVPA